MILLMKITQKRIFYSLFVLLSIINLLFFFNRNSKKLQLFNNTNYEVVYYSDENIRIQKIVKSDDKKSINVQLQPSIISKKATILINDKKVIKK
jgi:hypothetical protein